MHGLKESAYGRKGVRIKFFHRAAPVGSVCEQIPDLDLDCLRVGGGISQETIGGGTEISYRTVGGNHRLHIGSP